MSDLSAIQGWLSGVQSTMAGLPSQFQAAAETGDFQSVLSEAQSILGAFPGGSAATGSAPSTATATNATPSTTSMLWNGATGGSTTSGSAVVSTAEKYLGVPYLWGGTSPSGFDCSGFVQYVYAQLGVTLPRTSEEQATVGAPVASLADAQPGDLVFFAGSDGTPSSPGHVGIYLGNGQMVDAPQTGMTVSIQPVGDPVAIRRIVPSATTAVAPAPASATSAATTVLTNAAAASTSGSAASTAPAAAAAAAKLIPSTASVAVPSSLAPIFQSAAGQYGVPATLLAAVAQVESGYNPSAVSSAGAEGVMQLMPSTAAGLGVNPLDPTQAIPAAAQLLSNYLAQFGSVPLALAAYNAGPNAVAQYGGVPPYGQTETYVQDVTQIAGGAS